MQKKGLLKYICVLFVWLLLAGKLAVAQYINNLGIDNGLSNNSVTCIFQDHYGFMWFGTYDGLNRYDGTNFKIFKNKWGDKFSLINNHINSITEDDRSRVWIGTDKGLNFYDYNNARVFPVYYRSFFDHKLQQVTSRINTLKTDKDGNVFIATNESLLICRRGTTICEQVDCLKADTKYNVQTLTIDRLNRIWVFVSDKGLGLYNPLTKSVSFVNEQMKGLTCITADPDNQTLWIGSESGLFKYSIAQNLIQPITGFKLSNNNVMQIYPDRQSQLWVATDGGGVNVINTQTHKITYIPAGETQGLLSSGSVYDIYEDHNSRKWVATLRGGVDIIDYNHLFKSITHDPLNKNSLINNFTRSFCEDEHANIWIGTAGGGLSFWDTHTNTYTNYTHNEGVPNSLSSNFVMSIINDHLNNIWIATFNGGINRFDKSTHSFKHYHCFNTVTQVEDRNAWKLFEDRQHNLWAATTRGGALYLYNSVKDIFDLYDGHLTDINCFLQDKGGVLWAGTNKQLVSIDIKNKRHQFTTLNSALLDIYEDSLGEFWIGTDGGLILYDRSTQKFKRFTDIDGLPGNSILNILEDGTGAIWLSTYNGLSKYNLRAKTFKNYYASDGLQSNQFHYNAALKLHNGEFLFGGIKGFNRFDPDSIKSRIITPKIFITNFRINNQPIDQDSAYTGKKSVINLDNITLPYDRAVFSVDFVALEYSFPDKINYAYYLEGWDHAWNEIGKVKTAYYSRLNEGHYILRIKSTNTDGAWSNNQRLIYITVLPPWYRTWWAYLLYTIMATTLGYLFWLYRIRQTRLKHEIEITTIKAEKEREINEKKLSFFTNVSHEFRTPLTLIINPIKDLMHDSDSKNKEELNIIYRNARRLLGLVDHLLLFRKAESENDKLNIARLNFVTVCNDVYQCFIHQAKIKKVNYDFQTNGDHIEVYADREKIEIALFNLISNAIKYTPEGGHIRIIVNEDEENVYLEVADNGAGIAPGTDDRLFEKFYQIKGDRSLKTGFGIGLYLAKNFIERHGGSISYKNNLGGGTIFTIGLKKGSQQFAAHQIFEDMPDTERHIHELVNDAEGDPSEIATEETSNLELLISDQQSLLVIDDNTEIREYIKKIFKAFYKV
jgi:signal transduction histidine kinase/ligand-binding sensor domain-containing protein